MATSETESKQRGLLIVIEGLDKAGKSTQCKLLTKSLNAINIPSKYLHFPMRTTAVGKIIDDYLNKRIELHDSAVHLLFSANRWEYEAEMISDMKSGVTLVVDRYSYSGVAFTAAKPGFSIDWCRGPEIGLPRPDLVIFLSLSQDVAAGRGDFGEERYEVDTFQKKVLSNFKQLIEPEWKILDASRPIKAIQKDIKEQVLEVMNEIGECVIERLWT
ncbi:Thymidylate kinase [Oopsacas minuta]|uniref:Thymidylate kinase n=1 Tax=Oopsacas minuta TaxID=111878 RepID=A0AAV7JYM2_9METZ|nr:Thymidylate kinase [Oopsacas minuta]